MKKIEPQNLMAIKELITAGETLIFPTETSYGLGCDATNQQAVNQIFKIKGRSDSKPLLIVVPTINAAKKYLVWSEQIDMLANKYWPGALTIVGQVLIPSELSLGVIGGDGTVAVRVTADLWLQQVLNSINCPLVATSANLAGEPNIYDSLLVEEKFIDSQLAPSAIICAGVLPDNPPSTIIKINSAGQYEILRQGGVVIVEE